MKKIPLTKGKFALVDNEDYEQLMSMGKWHIGSNGYAQKTVYIGTKNGKRSTTSILMHRVILGMSDPTEQGDHADGNRLNNTRINLRKCSAIENLRNVGVRKCNTSGFKGVEWHKHAKKWGVRIRTCKGARKHIGLFTCPVEAAKAYNEAAIKYHGEFAKLNKI